MKKILPLCISCIILILLCCSCGWFSEQNYTCNIDEVQSIQIVRLDKYIEEEYIFEYTILSQISDSAAFIGKLNKLKHSVNWGDPRRLNVQDIVIRVEYCNGDFDLIHPDAQCFNRSGVNQNGYFFFDDEQFNLLVSDYTTE